MLSHPAYYHSFRGLVIRVSTICVRTLHRGDLRHTAHDNRVERQAITRVLAEEIQPVRPQLTDYLLYLGARFI